MRLPHGFYEGSIRVRQACSKGHMSMLKRVLNELLGEIVLKGLYI